MRKEKIYDRFYPRFMANNNINVINQDEQRKVENGIKKYLLESGISENELEHIIKIMCLGI